jgi:hypothetical protein
MEYKSSANRNGRKIRDNGGNMEPKCAWRFVADGLQSRSMSNVLNNVLSTNERIHSLVTYSDSVLGDKGAPDDAPSQAYS